MLKLFRIIAASVFFTALTVLFLDFSETVPTSWHGFAHTQIVPAMTACPVIVLGFWLIITLLFGRLYCSTVCPCGFLQDIIARAGTLVFGIKKRFRYRSPMTKTRSGFLLVFIAGCAAFPLIVSLLDPYSNYGRIITSLVRPVYLGGNNFIAWFSGGHNSYLQFKAVPFWGSAFGVAVFFLFLAGILSFLYGRRYCNIICPVGTLLGLLSRFSFFRIRIKSGCLSCGLCEKTCKGECIDSKAKTVDASRCVTCFNCLGVCKKNSIAFTTSISGVPPISSAKTDVPAPLTAVIRPVQTSALPLRRTFFQWSIVSLGLSAIFNSAQRAAANTDAAGLPTGTSRIGFKRTQPVLPPGAVNRRRYHRTCTACHLCVAKCPANVLVPATTELGLAGFLQPVMKFDNGFCNFDCTICAEVCPAHALRIESKAAKHQLQTGRVIFLKENCVVHTQGTNCGACAEHCPTSAVTMRQYGDDVSLTIPETDADLCVGCGACERICPVKPFKAIYVDGLETQGKAKQAYDPNEKQKETEINDFGF
ncbi:MAG: 4Fe-4S binding protein [Planctomycetaceae bacterium]|jgi:ferredoxin|nr:4Fe-4S binding protein [Planctomycetaceae bacterium]